MKKFIIIGIPFLLLILFPFCSSLEKQPGSIGKQADLVEDLILKLPSEDRPRYIKFLSNIRTEEAKQDHTIATSKEEASKATSAAGKWYGVRNTFFAIFGVLLLSLVGYVVFKLGLIKIPIIG